MNRNIISYFNLLVTAAAIVLVATGQYEVGMYVSFVGTITSVIAVKKVTLLTDPYTHVINNALLGFCLCPTFEVFPYFLVSCLFLSMTGFIRAAFAEKLGIIGAIWIEPFVCLTGIAFYIAANLLIPIGWQGWALPAFMVIFTLFLTIAGLADYKQMKTILGKSLAFNVEIGKPAPDFSLPDHEGKITTLSEYSQQRKNVLLIFVRGDWCPSCHIMLRTYQRNKEKFGQKNITIMAIGPDPVGVNREMVESLNVDYKILADEALECSRKYGIKRAPNNPGTNYTEGIPLPASFLVCQQGVLRYTSRADKPGEILNPAEIFSVLDQLN